jgi:hypothetical protein
LLSHEVALLHIGLPCIYTYVNVTGRPGRCTCLGKAFYCAVSCNAATKACVLLLRAGDDSTAAADDVWAKAQVLLQCEARATPEEAAKAAESPTLRHRSAADLQASLRERGWQVGGVHTRVLQTATEYLCARVLFAELHRYTRVVVLKPCLLLMLRRLSPIQCLRIARACVRFAVCTNQRFLCVIQSTRMNSQVQC